MTASVLLWFTMTGISYASRSWFSPAWSTRGDGLFGYARFWSAIIINYYLLIIHLKIICELVSKLPYKKLGIIVHTKDEVKLRQIRSRPSPMLPNIVRIILPDSTVYISNVRDSVTTVFVLFSDDYQIGESFSILQHVAKPHSLTSENS